MIGTYAATVVSICVASVLGPVTAVVGICAQVARHGVESVKALYAVPVDTNVTNVGHLYATMKYADINVIVADIYAMAVA